MNGFRGALIAGAALLVSAQSFADDSSAALGMGGLEFTRSNAVRMAREDLSISPKDVRIRYEFANDGASDVTTLVAFPLPDIDLWEFYESPIGTIGEDPVNFVGFTATVDGKRVPVIVEQRAFLGNRDVTDIVRAAGAPVNALVGDGIQKLDHLPADKKRILENAGLAEAEAPDQEHPKWIVRTKFYWSQTFPAHKTVTIEHAYHPVTGQTFFTEFDLKPTADSGRNWQRDTCMDGPTVTTIRKMLDAQKGAQNGQLLNIYSTDFILKTANYWKAGIGTLHVTFDKLKPDNVLSLCWAGSLKKTGATTFESTLSDVYPASDIHMVVLESPTRQ